MNKEGLKWGSFFQIFKSEKQRRFPRTLPLLFSQNDWKHVAFPVLEKQTKPI